MRIEIALGIALVLTAPAAAQVKEEKEITEVGGRTLEQWTKDITHKDPSKRENAIRAVLGFGPEKAYYAVPAMLTELRRNSSDSPIDTSVRVNLAISLGAILSTKKDPDPKVVKDAVVLLTRLLRDSQGIVKYRAAQALSSIGTEARSATPELLLLLRDRQQFEVRQAGALTLAKVARDSSGAPPGVVSALKDLLPDPAYQVRQAACQAIAMLGPPSEPAQKFAIIKLLEPVAKKDSEPIVQIWAHLAIMGYYNKTSESNLEPITQYLHKGDTATRIGAAQALGIVGPLAKETVPALIGALSDQDPAVVGFCILALGRMESARAIPALEKYAADGKQEELKKTARETVEQLKKKLGAVK